MHEGDQAVRLAATKRGVETEDSRDAFAASGQPTANVDEKLLEALCGIGVGEKCRGVGVVA